MAETSLLFPDGLARCCASPAEQVLPPQQDGLYPALQLSTPGLHEGCSTSSHSSSSQCNLTNWGAKRKRSFSQTDGPETPPSPPPAAAPLPPPKPTPKAPVIKAKKQKAAHPDPGSVRLHALLTVAARMYQESYSREASRFAPPSKAARAALARPQEAVRHTQQHRLPPLKIKHPYAAAQQQRYRTPAKAGQHAELAAAGRPPHQRDDSSAAAPLDSDSSACSAMSSEMGVRIGAQREEGMRPVKLFLPRDPQHDQPGYQALGLPAALQSVHRRKRKPSMATLAGVPRTPKAQQIRGKHSLKDIKATDFVCYACSTRSTPTWRWFRDRLVCNACGLRFARGKARMQLHQQ